MFRLNRQRSAGLIALAALIIYIGWIGGPYLRSVILRDAAVTSWINPAPAPIVGYVGPRPLYPGERVGAEGRIAVIEDPLADVQLWPEPKPMSNVPSSVSAQPS